MTLRAESCCSGRGPISAIVISGTTSRSGAAHAPIAGTLVGMAQPCRVVVCRNESGMANFRVVHPIGLDRKIWLPSAVQRRIINTSNGGLQRFTDEDLIVVGEDSIVVSLLGG